MPLDDNMDVARTPSWWETTRAAVQSSNIIGAALSSETLREGLLPSDTTPVTDQQIDEQIGRAGLVNYTDHFIDVRTQGQLNAKVSQLHREIENQKILELSGGSGFVLSTLAGVADLPSLIPGLAVGTVAARTGMSAVKAGAVAGASSAALQATVSEAALMAVNELESMQSAGITVAGATVFGGLLGAGIAKAFGPRTQIKAGEGARAEIAGLVTGRAEEAVAKLDERVGLDAAKFAAESPAARSEVGARMIEAVGRDLSPSELAFQKSFGIDTAVRGMSRLLGGNIALDLAVSPSKVAREAVFNFANTRSMIEGVEATSPQVMAMVQRVYGQQSIAKKELIDGWHSWARENASVSGFVERNIREDLSLERFSEAVAHAAVWGEHSSAHPNEGMRALMQSPQVQKAAKAYRKFDAFVGQESVRAGLIRKGHLTEDHFGHVYHKDNIARRPGEFVTTEARHAFEREFADIEKAARTSFTEGREKLDALTEKRLQAAAEESKAAATDKETKGLAQIIADEELAKAREADRWGGSLRFAREADAIDARLTREMKAREREIDRMLRSRAMKAADPLEREALVNEKVGLLTKYENLRDERVKALEAKFDAEWQAKVSEIDARSDARIDRALERLRQVIEKQQSKGDDRSVKAIEAAHRKELARLHAALDMETGVKAQAALQTWARDHADGVLHAILHGETGGGSYGQLTGGNIRGGNKARNVYTPTHALLNERWIEPDVLKVMDRMARQQGFDSVMARKFRRPLTEEEIKLARRNSPEAYWLDGEDRMTVADLDLRGVKERLRAEYDELRGAAKAKGDLPEILRLVDAHNRDLDNLTDMTAIGRGLARYDMGTRVSRPAVQLGKAFNFSVFMGKNAITNLGDIAKLPAVHGLTDTFAYLGLRAREKWRSMLDDGTIWKDTGRTELKEIAAAANIGLEGYNFNRLIGATDVADPFSQSVRSTKAERFANFLTEIGSKAFMIEHLNNAVKTAAYGIAQHRLAKAALSGKQLSEMPLKDANWLKFIGADTKTLGELRQALQEAGVAYKRGEPLRFDPATFSPALEDRVMAMLTKDATTTVVTPDALSKPRATHNPIVDFLTQFSTFALESGMSTTNMFGQRLRSGEISTPLVGMLAMASVAWMTQWLSIFVEGKDQEKKMERFWRAHERNPGFVTYTMLDRSGIFGPFTYFSNIADDTLGVGIRSAMRGLMGDDVKDAYPFSRRRFGQTGDAWKALGGAGGRTIADTAQIFGDVVGSLAGQKHGYLPLLSTDRRITQTTVNKAAQYTPLVNTFYLRALLDGVFVQPVSASFPKHK